jgi:hypothetical protein
MNKFFYLFATAFCLMSVTSCLNSYNIEGSSDISGLDSRMMFLKAVKSNELKDVDSTEIIHGKFSFTGTVDSSRIGFLIIDNNSQPLPLVLENGDIRVRINNSKTEWGGTPLNDRLYRFMKTLDSLTLQSQELQHEYDRAFMDGEDMAEVVSKLGRQNQLINMSLDTLFTQSISSNFDNVLGPGLFMIVTLGQMPEMSPWVVELMSKATDNFKNDPYVKKYLENASHLQNMQNGLEAPPQTAAPQPQAQQATLPTPPTPNELAKPAEETKDQQTDDK